MHYCVSYHAGSCSLAKRVDGKTKNAKEIVPWLQCGSLFHIGIIILPITYSYCFTAFTNQNYLLCTCKSKQKCSAHILLKVNVFLTVFSVAYF